MLSKFVLTLGASESANCRTNILKVVQQKFLHLVFVHIYFTVSIYIINIIYMAAVLDLVRVVHIPYVRFTKTLCREKPLLWRLLPFSGWRAWISPWVSPVQQGNRLLAAILWYLHYSTFSSTQEVPRTWYQYPVGAAVRPFRKHTPAPPRPNNDGAASEMQLLAQG